MNAPNATPCPPPARKPAALPRLLRALAWVATFSSLAHSPGVGAQELPLWEMNLGIGGLSVPLYRGADARAEYLLPVPYLIYRGERLRVDDEGLRGRLFRSERLRLDLSLAGGVPVPNERGSKREGMPELNPTLEAGPELELRLWSDATGQHRWWLKLPLRASFAIDDWNISHTGTIFSPLAQYSVRTGRWQTSLSFGPMYADRSYHNYFYQVEPQFVRPNRPSYQPDAGYSGSRFTVSVLRRTPSLLFGGFVRYDLLGGARFVDSPLVETENYLAVGFIATWRVLQSARTVPASGS